MKNTLMILLVATTWSAFLGCAEVTTKTFGANKTVTVKYSKGWFMDDKNRAKAIEEAQGHCRPQRAVLVREDNKAEFTGQTYTSQHTDGNYSSGQSSQSKEANVYLHFVCKRA